MIFSKPTIVTITAPTCAGKSYLLEELLKHEEFTRLISTTDRAPRAGEVEGLHYYFIDTATSMQMELDNKFVELVTYLGVRYGVTLEELQKCFARGKTPVVIVEPTGLEMYHKFAKLNGSKFMNIFSIYVHVNEATRIDRLRARSSADLREAQNAGKSLHETNKIVNAFEQRLSAIQTVERQWISKHSWNVIVSGEDTRKAISDILQSAKLFNDRISI